MTSLPLVILISERINNKTDEGEIKEEIEESKSWWEEKPKRSKNPRYLWSTNSTSSTSERNDIGGIKLKRSVENFSRP